MTAPPADPTPTPTRRPRRHRQLTAGVTVVVVVAAVSVLAPWLAPHDPLAVDEARRYLTPFAPGHLLGTDEHGRDLLSRLIWGGRATVLTTVLATSVAVAAGTVLGLVAAFAHRWISGAVMRIVDLLFAFPVIIVALSVAEVAGLGTTVVAVSIVFSAVPYVTRIVFAEALREQSKEYVQAARVLGAGTATVALREVMPNIGSTVLVYWSSLVGILVVFASSLSSLGIGVQPPTPDWGRMVAEGAKVLIVGLPHVAVIPGLAIALVGLAFNQVGDGLRDRLDPRRSR